MLRHVSPMPRHGHRVRFHADWQWATCRNMSTLHLHAKVAKNIMMWHTFPVPWHAQVIFILVESFMSRHAQVIFILVESFVSRHAHAVTC